MQASIIMMIEEPERPILAFSDVVQLCGATSNQLRNFMEGRRAILQVGTKVQGQWRFNLRDLLQITIVSDLNTAAGVPPQKGAEIARRLTPLAVKSFGDFMKQKTDGIDVLCALNGSAEQPTLICRSLDQVPARWTDLTTGEDCTPSEAGELPPIAERAHITIPIDDVVYRLMAALKRLVAGRRQAVS